MKQLFSLLLTASLFASHVVAQEAEKAREPYLHEVANGLQIQAYDTDTMVDDTTDMLGIRFWKIRFSTKEKGKQLMTHLELRTPGKESRRLGGGTGISPLEKVDIILGIQPVDGDYLSSSPKTRFYTRLDDGREAGRLPRKPGNSYTNSNPFLNLGGYSMRQQPLVRADGTILLLSFGPSSKDGDPKNSELVVVATLQEPPPAQ